MNDQQIQVKGRINELDIIRGFAVMGIFFVNVPEMFGNGSAFVATYTGADAFMRLVYDLFFQTKFYTIFSFLFGLGFYLFMQSAERRGLPMKTLFTRRLFFLLLLGVTHGIFLWFGDILYTYALTGFLLLLFYNRSAKTALVWSISLLALYTLFIGLNAVLVSSNPELMENSGLIFSSVPDLAQRADFLLSSGLPNVLFLSLEILGLFLLGLYAGKKQWFLETKLKIAMIKRVQWVALGVSLLMFIPMIRYGLSHPVYDINQVYHFTYLTGKTMAVFYICTLLRLVASLGVHRFSGLAAIGRMALTNYLSQSIVTMIIVYWIWTGASQSPLWVGMIYSILFLIVQSIVSKLWLRHYRMGPMEWVWRCATYGQWLPLRRMSAATAESK
ncbi:hypothetical protein D3C73_809600 [compost metagenome]